MKIKLDENLPSDLKEIGLCLGHDVHSVFDEALNGKPDALVWQACLSENRFLITQDLDFSDARKYPPGSHPGILVLRLRDDSRRNLIAAVRRAFETEDLQQWQGGLVVLTDHKLRIRKA